MLPGYLKPANNASAATVQFCSFQYNYISLSALDPKPSLLGSGYCMFAGFVLESFLQSNFVSCVFYLGH